MIEEDFLPAEHALGLADATGREEQDPAFAAAVEAWRARFNPLLGPERAPPPQLWNRILEHLPANDTSTRAAADPARRWRFATLAASVAATVLLGLLIARPGGLAPAPDPTQITAVPPRLMVASLMSKAGAGVVSVTYDDREGRMTINPVGLDARGKTPELWMIPADGRPRSLGLVHDKTAATMILKPGHRGLILGGVTLAVSLEPQGGSPTGQPTGPVVMTGVMSVV